MKAYIILINWMLSFMALSIDTENSALWAVAVVVAWFCVSSAVLIRAGKKGVFNEIEKRFKIDEL